MLDFGSFNKCCSSLSNMSIGNQYVCTVMTTPSRQVTFRLLFKLSVLITDDNELLCCNLIHRLAIVIFVVPVFLPSSPDELFGREFVGHPMRRAPSSESCFICMSSKNR